MCTLKHGIYDPNSRNVGTFLNLNRMKAKRIANHMSQYFIHNRTLNLFFFLQSYAQNELISYLMPATGLKIIVTGGGGACLPWCSISSSFQNSLKTSGHRCYEFLELWCLWNLVPFVPDISFQLLKSLWSSLMYFSFNDAPNVLYR